MNNDLAKIKLIYEFNHDSPLFARVAEAELTEGNLENALQILNNGLKIYPDYISAQLVYIEALAKQGNYKKVIEKLDEIRPKLNDDTVINYYLEKIENDKTGISNSEDAENNKPPKTFDNELENLAETISKAKIPSLDDSQKNNQNYSPVKGNQFISETLAEIYFSQANYKEALDIYEKLLESNPKKSEHFEQKIREIKLAMNK